MTATPGDEAAIRHALSLHHIANGVARYYLPERVREEAEAALDRLVAALTAAQRERDAAEDALREARNVAEEVVRHKGHRATDQCVQLLVEVAEETLEELDRLAALRVDPEAPPQADA